MFRRDDQRSAPLRDLLIAVARSGTENERIDDLVVQIDGNDLLTAATHHHMVSLLHERLRRLATPPDHLVKALAERRMRHQLYCLHLQHVHAAIADALEVPWLSVKGSVLAGWYSDPSTREFNDLDIVFRPSDFADALHALEVIGARPIGENWHGYLRYAIAEVPLQLGAAALDLHWHLVGMGEARDHTELPTESLFERAESVTVAGTSVLTLDPQDTLLHLCVNTGLDGARRLRSLIDIDTAVRSDRVDLPEFARRAREAQVGRIAAAVLQRSSGVLETPLPDGLLAELASDRLWVAANRLIDRTGTQSRRSATSGVASGLLLSSARDSRRATIGAFGRNLGRLLLQAGGRPGLTQPGGALDWQQSPADGRVDAHRSAYLDWVATEAT